MSLNRRRRIFRPHVFSLPRGRMALPRPGLWLAAAGGSATVLLALWLLVRPSHAPAFAPTTTLISAPAGELAVVDGDTLRVGQQVVRIQGIAAPARGSACGATDCAAAATNALAALIRNQTVACAIEGHDRQGRPVGNCLAGGVQLNEAMVRAGWAHAVTATLHEPETTARTAGKGIWQPAL